MRVPFSDPQAYRTDRFHSAMLTAVEFFEFFLLLLALRQLQGVPWDYLFNELVLLRQLTPLLVMSRFELYETCMVFPPRLYDPVVASTLLLTEGQQLKSTCMAELDREVCKIPTAANDAVALFDDKLGLVG